MLKPAMFDKMTSFIDMNRSFGET